MTDLNKVVKVALVALTMMVGAQSASADAVTSVVESSKAPFGFATRSSRTDASSTYDITGGGAYTVDAIKAMMTTGGITEGAGGSATVDGKKIIVLVSDGTSDKASAILSAITDNDIIVFDGSGTSTDFQVYAQITLRNLSGKTLLGINGARLCTRWHMTDVIKSWLNAVETSSGSGVSNASTASGTGGSFWLKNIAGEDSLEITIDEEGEWLTRMTLANKGQKLFEDWRDGGYEGEEPENSYFLRTERYRKSGIFYIEGCENVIIRNISFVGPGSVDVGGVDLISAINGTNHVWVDHCEFIDGQDGNFDITNYSDYITVSWCHFHYTDRSYVHQNTNLVGSGDDKARNTSATGDYGKLNTTFAYNEWGENCRSRMPMGRAGKIHMLNNWYNCAGNTENAINPRLNSEYLVEGNYFASGVTKTFKANSSVGVSVSDNTTADASATKVTASGSTVTVPYTYAKIASTYVPDSVELLVGPVLDKVPTYTMMPGGVNATTYELNTTSTRASQGLTFSVWADYTMKYQWYYNTTESYVGAKALDKETLNSYTATITRDSTVYYFCEATGLAGAVKSKFIKVVVSGTGAPIITSDLTGSPYSAAKGIEYSLSITASGADSYQWYHNTVESTEGATAVVGQTTNTLTYTTPTGDAADRTDFYFCVASCTADGVVLDTYSKIARVKYVSQQMMMCFEAASGTAGEEGGGAMSGVDPEGNSWTIVNKGTCGKESKFSKGCLTFPNGFTAIKEGYTYVYTPEGASKPTNCAALQLAIEGGFKSGWDVTIEGFVVTSGKTGYPAIFTLNEEGAYGETLSEFTTSSSFPYFTSFGTPGTLTYKLTADYDTLYIGRANTSSATKLYISKVMVTRGEPTKPYITTDLRDSYEGESKSAVSGLSIAAEDVTSYMWLTCGSASDYELDKDTLEGQTSATCTQKFSAGTHYVYCIAINGSGETAKRDTSRIATLTIAKSPSVIVQDWVFTEWETADITETTSKDGLTAVIDKAANKMTVSASATNFTVDGETWRSTKRMQLQGSGSSTKRCLKFDVDGPTVVQVWGAHASSSASNRPLMMKVGSADADTLYLFTKGNETAEGTHSYTGTESATIYIYSGNSGLNIYRIRATTTIDDDAACAKPTATRGTYVPASTSYNYNIKTTTSSAYIKFKIGDEEAKISHRADTTVVIPCETTVTAFAYDPATVNPKDTSAILTFTADAIPKTKTPTITIGNYSVASHKYPTTITAAEGATIYYTTDGTTPTTSSSVYSTSLNLDGNVTINAMATLSNYANSSVASKTTLTVLTPGGDEQTLKANGTTTNVGVSYTVASTSLSGSANKLTDGLKFNLTGTLSDGSSKGCVIDVNSGFRISKIVAREATSNDTLDVITLTGVYVDGDFANNKLAESITLPDYRSSATSFTAAENIDARTKIEFAFTAGSSVKNNQANILFDIYYDIIDSPTSFVINEESPIAIGSFTDNVYTTATVYEDNPTIVMTTTQGYQYTLSYDGADGDLSKFAFNIMGTKYTIKARVINVNPPLIRAEEDFTLGPGGKGGRRITLTDIKEGANIVPYIKIDGGAAEVYDDSKLYLAVDTVTAYCTYKNAEEETVESEKNGLRLANTEGYDSSKPFAVYLYVDGYADTGTGQEKGTIASSFDPSTDKIHLGLADQFNVLDYHKASVGEKMVNEVFPDITNAKLVVISEMIGSGSATSGSVYESSGASNFSMSLRDSLINHTNVLNLKMFFYSQSKNNTQRWAWAQPTTLTNSVVSIVPTNAMYKVFEDVAFSKDGSLALWSRYDEESTLNRLQLVHNYNEANEDLPEFTLLATATDIDGEVYDALHYFEKDGYTYVATGISINDNEHYDDNLRYLVSTIGSMIKAGESLGTTLTDLPAPRIKDNGDGSATITNNNASAVTYYKTSASANETWSAETIKADNKTTYESVTDKFNSNVYVYAISDVSGTLSAVSKAAVAGSTKRYFHRTNADAEAEGLESSVPFTAETATITIPYNQSFRKAGYTVTQWKDKKTGTLYTPGASFSTTALSQDLYLEAVWTANTKKITDLSAETEAQRTVTWNFLQTDGAPALSLEYGSTKVAQQGFIVGQAKFSDGTFIDVAMDIDADNTTTIPGSSTEYTGKFNNKQNVLSDATKYVTEFAQVRAGTKFTFPAVYGMTVKFKQAHFEKYDGTGKREADDTYVTQSILVGSDTTFVSNPGLTTADGVITETSGVASVAADNLTTGGIFNYVNGNDTLTTLITRECAMYVTPSAEESSKTVGALNKGTSFMHSLSVIYPSLYDITENVTMPVGHVNILPDFKGKSDSDLTEEELAYVKSRAAVMTLSDARKNTGGHYAVGDSVSISVKPGYSFYFNTEAVPADVSTSGLTEGTGTSAMTIATKLAGGKFKVGTTPTVNVTLNQKTVYEYNVTRSPLDAGTVRLTSNTGKDESEEYTAFPLDSVINITPTPKMGYQFKKWVNEEGTELVFGSGSGEVDNVVKDAENGNLTVTVTAANSAVNYVAVFEKSIEGTVNYRVSYAGLITGSGYENFAAIWPDEIDTRTAADTTALFNYYHFPKSRTANALYIPTNYTLYKEGYTISHWAHITGFTPEKTDYDPETEVEEYQIGKFYYFESENENRDIIPIFKANTTDFKYRNTSADITWDFRTAYYAQHLKFDERTEFDYATHATFNSPSVVMDVPLHINATSADNETLDEWCHFGEGTVITIPSGLGAKFTIVTYNRLTTTTIDGVAMNDLDPVQRTENDIPVYYYTYTTENTATTIDLVIGNDHTYYKSIRAQLPSADKVTLTTTVNNSAFGSHAVIVKASTTAEKMADANEPSDVAYTTVADTESNTYTMSLGSYVRIKATRQRLYELKAFVVDGDSITAANATSKGYTLTEPAGTDKDYTLTFRLFSYATTVEAVYGERTRYQITYTTGGQASGEAPGAVVIEEGESFTTPKCNQTLYLEGYTLKYWVDEAGNKYEWNTTYTPGAGVVPLDNLYLTPVFDINDFTLFDIPASGATASWPLATGSDATYGGAPLLKYQKSAGVYVAQLAITTGTFAGKFIDMKLDIDCTASSAKVDNSATDYRCQINTGSVISVPTNDNCTITLVTANGTISSTKIGETVPTGSQEAGTTNDWIYSQSYSGSDAKQDISFAGDAGYFKMIKVVYGKTKNTDVPTLAQVTVNNIALGSFGTDYENYTLSTLVNNNTITIPITLSTTALTMPKVKAVADADHRDALIECNQATVSDTTATVILKTAKGVTVGIYKIVFDPTYSDIAAPELQKIEMNNILVKALDVNDVLQTYLTYDDSGKSVTKMGVNGAISITFDHEMAATDTINTAVGKVISSGGTTLTFSYWGLDVGTTYPFTIPANTLYDKYGNRYASEISFSFTTAATTQLIEHKNVDFVVTHKQTHTFNSANPEANYTSTAKQQVASDELIANLAAKGIAYGTIDEGIALAHSSSATARYRIFVPDGEYQLRGNTTTGSLTSAIADNSGTYRDDLKNKNVYNGATVISRNNVSITGQSETGTKLWNKPEIEGISYTSTFRVNSGVSGFYMQDMTLTNVFDYKTATVAGASAARAVVLRDSGIKTIMKNITMDSWQDTYYSNSPGKDQDTRGYLENCTIKGYVDFICGDGDHWFQNCTLMMRNGKSGNASNMMAPRQYAEQKWGYVFKNCNITTEDEITYATCNNKFTIARPWDNSPAASLLGTTYYVLSTADGYKAMSQTGKVLRIHEYESYDADGALLDLSGRSLRASSPGAGSYTAVMTPAESEQYTLHNVLGGSDGYDPTLYTAQISMADAGLTSVDRSLSWTANNEALCYFIFRKNASDEWDLYAITEEDSYELDDTQIGNTFMVRAANQRGGLGEMSNEFTYEVHESYKLTLTDATKVEGATPAETWCWSTIYLDYNAKAPTVADEDEEADVYVYAVVDVTATSMTLKRVNILEKNQGYIVKGREGTYTFSYTDSDGKYWDGSETVADSRAESEGRMSILDGVVERTRRAGKSVYTLYYKANYGVGFYSYTGTYLNAYKAYLDAGYVSGDSGSGGYPLGTSASGFIFLDDVEPTTIKNVNDNDNSDEKIFTVYGQRVKRSEMIKGRVYIVNGRKIAY